MGLTLTGKKPKDTYQGIIKFTDNQPLSTSYKLVSDGYGNDSVLELSTNSVRIGAGQSKKNISDIEGSTGKELITKEYAEYIAQGEVNTINSITEGDIPNCDVIPNVVRCTQEEFDASERIPTTLYIIADKLLLSEITSYVERVELLGGSVDKPECIGDLDGDLVMYPSGYRTGKLYSQVSNDGSSDFDVVRATTPNRIDASGATVSVPANTPIIDHTDPDCPVLVVDGDIITGKPDASKFNSEEFTLVVESKANSADGTQRFLSLSDGTSNNRSRVFYQNNNTQIIAQNYVGGTLTGSVIHTPTSILDNHLIAWRCKEDDFSLWIDAEKVGEDLSGAIYSPNTLDRLNLCNAQGNSLPFNASIKKLKVFNRYLEYPEIRKETLGVIPSGYSYVKKSGDILTIQAPYSTTKDIVFRFEKCLVNDLMTFENVGTVDTGTFIETDNLLSTNSDNIGPISIKDGGFVGGNHTYNGEQSATTTSYKFLLNGKEITEEDTVLIGKVSVEVINDIYDPRTLTALVQDVLYEERVVYTVREGSISVDLKLITKIDNVPQFYYGMQLSNHADQDTVYMAHADDTSVRTKVNGLSSGPLLGQDIVPEKMIVSNTAKTNNIALWMSDKGLASNRINEFYDPSADDVMFTSSNKVYHRLIRQVNTGTYEVDKVVEWSGTYTFFDNSDISFSDSNIEYAYFMYKGNDKYLVVDVKGIVSDNISHPSLVGKSLTIEYKDDTITVGNTKGIDEAGITLSSVGYGNVYLKIE